MSDSRIISVNHVTLLVNFIFFIIAVQGGLGGHLPDHAERQLPCTELVGRLIGSQCNIFYILSEVGHKELRIVFVVFLIYFFMLSCSFCGRFLFRIPSCGCWFIHSAFCSSLFF